MSFPLRHLLGIEPLEPQEIQTILDTADGMKEILDRPIKKVPVLRGKTVVNLFYEASTRTRSSFEIAERVLSADSLSIAAASSSVVKGETLLDTAKNLEAMNPDMVILRHASSGAPQLLARHCRFSVVNAGDGAHEHPTQALLDAFTIRERKQRIAGLKVAICGDLLHSRVLRSNVLLLTKMGADVWLCGPPTLMPVGFERTGAHVTSSVDEAVEGADAVMMLRIQLERMLGGYFPTLREYFTAWIERQQPPYVRPAQALDYRRHLTGYVLSVPVESRELSGLGSVLPACMAATSRPPTIKTKAARK